MMDLSKCRKELTLTNPFVHRIKCIEGTNTLNSFVHRMKCIEDTNKEEVIQSGKRRAPSRWKPVSCLDKPFKKRVHAWTSPEQVTDIAFKSDK